MHPPNASHPTAKHMETAVVVVVNWNGYEDTIECLTSVVNLDYAGQLQIVISDNDSTDMSVRHIVEWIEATGVFVKIAGNNIQYKHIANRMCVNIVENSRNLGYAAGVNAGIRYAGKTFSPDYIWILNNDTIVEPLSLESMIERVRTDPSIGICGATILHYDRPDVVQAYGGVRYNRWTGRGRHLGSGNRHSREVDRGIVEDQLTYVSGACMLVSRKFIHDVGLMNEEYFLYNEELDWASRSRAKYKPGYAPDAIVYHKEGSSVGTETIGRRGSRLSEFYLAKSKLKYTWKYHPLCFTSVWLVVLLRAIKLVVCGHVPESQVVFHALCGRKTPKRGWNPLR